MARRLRWIPWATMALLVAPAGVAAAQLIDFDEPLIDRFGRDGIFGRSAFGGGFGLGSGGDGDISFRVRSEDYATPEAFQAAVDRRLAIAERLSQLDERCQVQRELLQARAAVTDGLAREELRDLLRDCRDERERLQDLLEPERRRDRDRRAAVPLGGSSFGSGSLLDDGRRSGLGVGGFSGGFEPVSIGFA